MSLLFHIKPHNTNVYTNVYNNNNNNNNNYTNPLRPLSPFPHLLHILYQQDQTVYDVTFYKPRGLSKPQGLGCCLKQDRF